ncbi:ABC transporter permease [Pelolinea submarina]|uniref:ABC-2 type transport system permease protein n=1 Tax=Pelolinea submarina TaxID=913107 RepID=A0A347ZS81_9CHLR|nr:ABC transporter permease [Pelolinea submarina]REG11273.1 ABC-2 type transport system permease protein [Pelolinea submarina]BBB48162.1 ABC-2 type transport system permease protein [Pelolinea submarina]
MKRIGLNLRIMARAFEIELRQNMTDGFVLFGILIQPLIVAFMALWMLKGKGPDYAIFVVIGSGMTGLWTTLLFNGGNSITGERWTGTLEPLVASPASLRVVIYGKVLANVTQSLLSMIGSYFLISFAMGYPLTLTYPGLFFLSLVISVFSLVSFGLILASFFILIPDFARMVNTLEFPVYILCGFLFPIALLPGWTTPLSYLLSPYWAALALHGAAQGTLEPLQIVGTWGIMAFFSLVYILASGRLYRVILRKARRDATLDIVGN